METVINRATAWVSKNQGIYLAVGCFAITAGVLIGLSNWGII